jgi:hypothetical protein
VARDRPGEGWWWRFCSGSTREESDVGKKPWIRSRDCPPDFVNHLIQLHLATHCRQLFAVAHPNRAPRVDRPPGRPCRREDQLIPQHRGARRLSPAAPGPNRRQVRRILRFLQCRLGAHGAVDLRQNPNRGG